VVAVEEHTFRLAAAMSVMIETSKGDIVIDLYIDEAPNACKNFLKLCK